MRMTSGRYIAILMISALFILLLPNQSTAQESARQTKWRQARFAVLPLANHTDLSAARESVGEKIRFKLESRCQLTPADSLRDFMRMHRLRLVGDVTSVAAAKLRYGLDVDYLITGAIATYQSGTLPEFSLCLRVYNCWEQEIAWIKCISASGQDYASLMNIGETSSLDYLVSLVIDEIIQDFESHRDGLQFRKPLVSGSAAKLLKDGLVAIVPFDQATREANADELVSELMLAEVWRRGYRVAEPGEVKRILTRARELYFGAATDRGLEFLSDSLNVKAVVSGTIFEFIPLKGRISAAGPVLALGLRLIEPSTGEVISALNGSRHGANVDSAFGTGREFAMGETIQSLVGSMWSDLVRQRRKVDIKQTESEHETVQR